MWVLPVWSSIWVLRRKLKGAGKPEFVWRFNFQLKRSKVIAGVMVGSIICWHWANSVLEIWAEVCLLATVLWRCEIQWREGTQGKVGRKAERAGTNWRSQEARGRKRSVSFLLTSVSCLVFSSATNVFVVSVLV